MDTVFCLKKFRVFRVHPCLKITLRPYHRWCYRCHHQKKQWGQVPVSTATFDGNYYPMSFYFSFKSDHLSELQEIVIWPDAHFLGIADKWQDVCLYLINLLLARRKLGECKQKYVKCWKSTIYIPARFANRWRSARCDVLICIVIS